MKDSIDNAGSKLYKGKKSINEILSGASKSQKLVAEPRAAAFKRSSTMMPSKMKSEAVSAKKQLPHMKSNVNQSKMKELEIDAEIESALNRLDLMKAADREKFADSLDSDEAFGSIDERGGGAPGSVGKVKGDTTRAM